MRAIDRLLAQFPPPAEPIDNGLEDSWPTYQTRLGSVLPRDYKDFINHYGSVWLYEVLLPLNPFSSHESFDLLLQLGPILGAWHELKTEQGPEVCPYPLWFEPDGLLPWGTTIDGDQLFWRTRGHPDQWTVVVNDRGAVPGFAEYEGGMVDFVLALLDGSLDRRLVPFDFEDGRPVAISPAVPPDDPE